MESESGVATPHPASPTLRVGQLEAQLGALPGLVVAFSGGADSAFLLAAAGRVLGAGRVLAVTAESASLPQSEKQAATAFAARLGIGHRFVATHEMDRDGYRANAGNRCYFCKAELLDVVLDLAEDLGWPVATGTNADDVLAGFRPGIRAAQERGALTPLADHQLTKAEVRAQSKQWGLATWDKPAAACLSSRIAYGLEITPSRLAGVERAEAGVRVVLRAAGVNPRRADLRVRDLGSGRARVELDADTHNALADVASVLAAVRECGFTEVELARFRSGSLNDALPSAKI